MRQAPQELYCNFCCNALKVLEPGFHCKNITLTVREPRLHNSSNLRGKPAGTINLYLPPTPGGTSLSEQNSRHRRLFKKCRCRGLRVHDGPELAEVTLEMVYRAPVPRQSPQDTRAQYCECEHTHGSLGN